MLTNKWHLCLHLSTNIMNRPFTTALGHDIQETLFCFALESEAGELFSNYRKVFTGIGKVGATYALSKAIADRRPQLIVNLGSAGSARFSRGTIVCCRKFVQRDMDVRGLGFDRYQTPLSNTPVVLEYGLSLDGLTEGICGSGDSFEMAHQTDIYDVVDMEAYALAWVAKQENIPFLSLKYITDGANDNAAEDWETQVHQTSLAFSEALGF